MISFHCVFGISRMSILCVSVLKALGVNLMTGEHSRAPKLNIQERLCKKYRELKRIQGIKPKKARPDVVKKTRFKSCRSDCRE